MFCPLEASTMRIASVGASDCFTRRTRSDDLTGPKHIGGEENKRFTGLAARCGRGCCVLIIRTLYCVTSGK